MKNSRTSLNKPFYDWIREVREADKKIAELEDKLYYYNVKLVGYNSPNFEPRLSSTKPEYKDNRYIWLDKISRAEYKMTYFYNLHKEYRMFKSALTKNEVIILENYLYPDHTQIEISRSYKYMILNEIAKKYLKGNLKIENKDNRCI